MRSFSGGKRIISIDSCGKYYLFENREELASFCRRKVEKTLFPYIFDEDEYFLEILSRRILDESDMRGSSHSLPTFLFGMDSYTTLYSWEMEGDAFSLHPDDGDLLFFNRDEIEEKKKSLSVIEKKKLFANRKIIVQRYSDGIDEMYVFE